MTALATANMTERERIAFDEMAEAASIGTLAGEPPALSREAAIAAWGMSPAAEADLWRSIGRDGLRTA